MGEQTKLGAGFDFGIRGINYDSQDERPSMDTYQGFGIMGITFVGLHSFDEFIYVMPKLSFDPIMDNSTDKPFDGMSTKFETSVGFRLLGNVGITITPGFEHLKFNIQDGNGVIDGKSILNFKYLNIGFAYALD